MMIHNVGNPCPGLVQTQKCYQCYTNNYFKTVILSIPLHYTVYYKVDKLRCFKKKWNWLIGTLKRLLIQVVA